MVLTHGKIKAEGTGTRAGGRLARSRELRTSRYRGAACLQPGAPIAAEIFGVPTGIRTPVTAVKGRCPRPLDDGDCGYCSVAATTSGWAGGGNRDRTGDLLHAMQALSQLSYTPNLRGEIIADDYLQGPTRLPVTLVRSSNFCPCTSPFITVSPSMVEAVMRAVPVPRIFALGHSICQL